MEEPISVEGLEALGRKLAVTSSGENGSGGIELAEELLRVRDRNGRVVPLKANPAQEAFERGRGRTNIILKARQMGMTTWVAGRFFLKTITTPGTMTVQVAQTREAAEMMFRMVQRFYDSLPAEYREGPLKRRRSTMRQMAFAELDSEFHVLSAADRNAGRGMTMQNLHCSEVSRWSGDARETLAGLRAALVPGGELVMESTPNGAYGCFYDQWRSEGAGALRHHFFPWWLEASYVAAAVTDFSEEEEELRARHGLSAEQIGYRRQLVTSHGALRSQEFAEDAETCFRATGDCCFEVSAIEKRLSGLEEPAGGQREKMDQRFHEAVAGRKYLVAVDPAGGGAEGDFSAIQVIDLCTGLQCAEWRDRHGPMGTAKKARDLATEYNKAMIVVERNNHGSGVLAFLTTSSAWENLYQEKGENGFLTTATSKPEMIANLNLLLVERPEMFQSRRLLAECRAFVNLKNGRTGAAAGSHDDLLMAMAIAHVVRRDLLQGKHLQQAA